jgi:hypothetical protein
MDANVKESLEKSEKFKEAKKLDWFEEWIGAKDKRGRQNSDERPFIA